MIMREPRKCFQRRGRLLILSKWRIPLCDLEFGDEERAAALRVLQSRWLSMGPEVESFEQEFAEFLGVRHAIAVANGTAALHLSYIALGLGPGDEIIQPSLNFVAAANMTVSVGATPVFADILCLEEPTIDPADIEARITPHTRAVIVMHYGGYPCRMAEISALCQREGLALIEDACHAVGARYFDPKERPPHNRMAGNLSDIACFSFFSNKNLATGEGGMVATNRDDLAERTRLLRSHGMTTLTWDRYAGHASSYDVVFHGYNYRLDELHAALGRVQLKKLGHNNYLRGLLVARYREHLGTLADWTIPFSDYPGDSAYHIMVVIAPNEGIRNLVVKSLTELGVQTSLHYPHVRDFRAFQRFARQGLDRSRSFSQRAMTLPLSPGMKTSHVELVSRVIRDIADQGGRK